jgi:hypothetical protein
MSNNSTSGTINNVVPFPVKAKETSSAPRMIHHRLLVLVADLSVAEKVDFVLDNLYREPPNDPETARKIAEANIAMFGHFLLVDILMEVASLYPEFKERYAYTISLIEPVRDLTIAQLAGLSSSTPTDL